MEAGFRPRPLAAFSPTLSDSCASVLNALRVQTPARACGSPAGDSFTYLTSPNLCPPVLKVHPRNVHSISQHLCANAIMPTSRFIGETVGLDVQQNLSRKHKATSQPACLFFLLFVMSAQCQTRVWVDEYSGRLVPKDVSQFVHQIAVLSRNGMLWIVDN